MNISSLSREKSATIALAYRDYSLGHILHDLRDEHRLGCLEALKEVGLNKLHTLHTIIMAWIDKDIVLPSKE